MDKTPAIVDTKGERSVIEKGKVAYGEDYRRDVIGSSGRKDCQIKCFKCLGIGHMAAQCPNRRVMAIVEAVSEDEVEESKLPEGLSAMLDEYYGDANAEEHGDKGDDRFVTINVLCWVLATTPTREEEQQENLFHIACRVKGNCCAFIVDRVVVLMWWLLLWLIN